MKKLFFGFLFITSIIQAQYKIVGTLNPAEKYTTALLYKTAGATDNYIKNTKINNGRFYFDMSTNEKPGSYKIIFDTKNNKSVAIFFNNEDVVFSFNPKDAENTKTFTNSDENKLYAKFLEAISYLQYEIDSLQIAYLKNPSESIAIKYKDAISTINTVQKKYIDESKGKLIHEFIKATDRFNALEIVKTPDEYLTGIKTHFFDNIDLENEVLYDSPFLIDRISDYVFYLNYSDDANEQNKLYKKAVTEIMEKIKNPDFKNDVIVFLIQQFTLYKNVVLVDYLFKNHFDTLPKDTKNSDFKRTVLSKLAAEIGRTAPDFSWEENGKTLKLSTLNEAKNYILVFWSTGCSHCIDEIPKLHQFLIDKKSTKVIAYALEDDATIWTKFTAKLYGWHHVLGLNKWENKLVRTYNINATPTYFVLDENKKIIARPYKLDDLKAMFN